MLVRWVAEFAEDAADEDADLHLDKFSQHSIISYADWYRCF